MGEFYSYTQIGDQKKIRNAVKSPYKYNVILTYGCDNKRELIKTLIEFKNVIKQKLKEGGAYDKKEIGEI